MVYNKSNDKKEKKFTMSDTLGKQMENNWQGESERAMFEALLKNYYLDDDQLDYLHRYYRSIFTFDDNEDCLCFSKKQYFSCCKPKMLSSQKNRDDYVSILQVINDLDLKAKYVQQEAKHILAVKNARKEEKCIISECSKKVVQYSLYSPQETVNKYYLNRYDPKHIFKKIDTQFLDLTVSNEIPYSFYCLCELHKTTYLTTTNILTPQLTALLMNMNDNLIDHQVSYETFLDYYLFLSVAEQVILTIKLRRLLKLQLAYQLELHRLLNDLTNSHNDYHFKTITVPFAINSLVCNDVLLAQITPITFQAINSPNNPFLANKLLYVTIKNKEKEGIIEFSYHKNNRIFNTYFEEWDEKIKNPKQWNNYASSFIINQGTHFLLDQKYYAKLPFKTKEMINIFYYNRFEQPHSSAEEMMLQTFINNFNNGINLLK